MNAGILVLALILLFVVVVVGLIGFSLYSVLVDAFPLIAVVVVALFAIVAIALVALLFMLPVYLRTKSLLLLCILWIMIGGFFIVAMPLASGIAVIFMALGIGGLFWKLYTSRYS